MLFQVVKFYNPLFPKKRSDCAEQRRGLVSRE